MTQRNSNPTGSTKLLGRWSDRHFQCENDRFCSKTKTCCPILIVRWKLYYYYWTIGFCFLQILNRLHFFFQLRYLRNRNARFYIPGSLQCLSWLVNLLVDTFNQSCDSGNKDGSGVSPSVFNVYLLWAKPRQRLCQCRQSGSFHLKQMTPEKKKKNLCKLRKQQFE